MEYGGNTYKHNELVEYIFIHILNDYTYNIMYTECSGKNVPLTESPSFIIDKI